MVHAVINNARLKELLSTSMEMWGKREHDTSIEQLFSN